MVHFLYFLSESHVLSEYRYYFVMVHSMWCIFMHFLQEHLRFSAFPLSVCQVVLIPVRCTVRGGNGFLLDVKDAKQMSGGR